MDKKDLFKMMGMFESFIEDLEKDFSRIIPQDEPVFTIEVVSNLTGIPYWQLRNFLKEELVCPQVVGKKKQLFSKNDVKRIECINYLVTEKGVNLAGVKVIFDIMGSG